MNDIDELRDKDDQLEGKIDALAKALGYKVFKPDYYSDWKVMTIEEFEKQSA